jgi:hypothetical protein
LAKRGKNPALKKEVEEMKFLSAIKALITVCILVLALTHVSTAQSDDYIKWYGVGGELDAPHHWLGRIGVTETLGAEIIFGMEHISMECDTGDGDCDETQLDVGGGLIYDFAPFSQVTPYVAGRFILSMTGDGTSETSGTVEAAGGAEYVIMKRIGLSSELNFSFSTDPTHILTTTRVRFYFYL